MAGRRNQPRKTWDTRSRDRNAFLREPERIGYYRTSDGNFCTGRFCNYACVRDKILGYVSWSKCKVCIDANRKIGLHNDLRCRTPEEFREYDGGNCCREYIRKY